MATALIPDHVKVLIIGGGPAGSYAASCLAREGIQTCVLEADKFPRYHVGESMMVAMRHFLRFIDLDEVFDKHGFTVKTGAAFKLNRHNREGYTDFTADGKNNYVWNLHRAQADELLLRHASTSGALVFEETRVTEVEFDGEDGTQARPISAKWRSTEGKTGKITFDWLVDASGRAGLVSTKNLRNRKFNESLKNVACWGYWKGTGDYSPQTSRRGSPFFEALTDQSGWAWFIPLHDGSTSVGVVLNQAISNLKRRAMPKEGSSLKTHYLAELERAPDIIALIGEGSLIDNKDGPTIRAASDYSYSASYYAGNHFRLAGDAGAFIDPFFSSGVHLAMSGGLSAAATISASIRGDCTESEAARWHSSAVGASYTRFLMVVIAAYKQMHAQDHAVLSDVDEDNFDRAFEHFRPIIQGHSDVAITQFSDDLKATFDFCSKVIEHIGNHNPAQTSVDGDVPTVPSVGNDQEDSKRVVAPSASHGETGNSKFKAEEMDNLVSDQFHGLSLRLKPGALGLQKL